jgi:hypothetical protein
MVSPWARIEAMTTPKVVVTMSSRWGKVRGSARASTIESPPRSPPQVRTAAHDAGMRSSVRRSARAVAPTAAARPRRTAKKATVTGAHAAAARRGGPRSR